MILFVDIDGTIRDYIRGIIPSAVTAIERARENGHTVILCTGRTVGMIPKDVPLNLFRGMIAGGGCYGALDGRIVENSVIPDGITKKYRAFFEQNGIPYALEAPEGIFMTEAMAPIIRHDLFSDHDPGTSPTAGMISESINCDRRTEEYDSRGCHASKLSVCMTPAQYERFSLPDEDGLTLIHFTDSTDGYEHCELIAKDCDKGAALVRMTRLLGADIADTVMFGDSMNDASAFAAAGTAVCMGNAPADVKALADTVTDHVLEDGFMKALIRLGITGKDDNYEI